jgi:glycine betaine/proline transport system substrate-binding protein
MLSLYIKKTSIVGLAIALIFSLVACQNTPQTTTGSNNESTSETESNLSQPGQGVSIRPAINLQEERFQTEIVNIGLEQLGYQIEDIKQLDVPALYVAMANGELDYIAMHWEKGHSPFFDKSGGDEKLERLGLVVPNLAQGYQVDQKTAQEYNITSFQQLQDPEIAKLFDSDGDGKANLTGCNAGWFCEVVINHHIQAYGLQDTVEQNQGTYSALIADTITRYQQGEPVVYYTWTPLWLSSVLKLNEDVVWLGVPYTDLPEDQKDLSAEDTSVNGKNLGFVVDQMRIVANQQFIDENPTAKRFFELVEIPLEDISAENQLIQQGEDQAEDIRRHAEAWVQQNQALFDSWLEEARAAAEPN